jgi:general nucleoside transport system permease protein
VRTLLRILVTFTAALAVGAVILLVSGRSPLAVYWLLFQQAFGSTSAAADTLLNATPLIFTGVATAVAFQAGVFNVGVEGSLYVGAFAAAWVGFTFTTLPGWLLIPIAFVAGGLAGLLWALLPAAMKAYLQVDEVVTTLLLNYVAIDVTAYLVTYPFLAPGAANSMSVPVAKQAELPRLLASSQLNTGFFVALAVAAAAAWLIRRSVLGYEIRSLGLNPWFARTMGMPLARTVILAMCVSGLIGGLGGAAHVLGVNYRFVQGFSPGYGFDGITVALMANNSPIGAILGAVLIGALRNGGTTMQLFTNIPLDLVNVLEAIVILLVTVDVGIRIRARRLKREPVA